MLLMFWGPANVLYTLSCGKTSKTTYFELDVDGIGKVGNHCPMYSLALLRPIIIFYIFVFIFIDPKKLKLHKFMEKL